jgi:hypothetical protein
MVHIRICVEWCALSTKTVYRQAHNYFEKIIVNMVTVHFVLLQLVLILFEGVGMGVGEGDEDELKGDGL